MSPIQNAACTRAVSRRYDQSASMNSCANGCPSSEAHHSRVNVGHTNSSVCISPSTVTPTAKSGRGGIGRASCRERECTYLYISVAAVSLKEQQDNNLKQKRK